MSGRRGAVILGISPRNNPIESIGNAARNDHRGSDDYPEMSRRRLQRTLRCGFDHLGHLVDGVRIVADVFIIGFHRAISVTSTRAIPPGNTPQDSQDGVKVERSTDTVLTVEGISHRDADLAVISVETGWGLPGNIADYEHLETDGGGTIGVLRAVVLLEPSMKRISRSARLKPLKDVTSIRCHTRRQG